MPAIILQRGLLGNSSLLPQGKSGMNRNPSFIQGKEAYDANRSCAFGRASGRVAKPSLPRLPAADHDFSLIIPAYNEEGRLPSLAEVRRFLDSSSIDYRVFVADDGSTDATPQLAAQWAHAFPPFPWPAIAARARRFTMPCPALPAA